MHGSHVITVPCNASLPTPLLLLQVPSQSLDDEAAAHASPPSTPSEEPAHAAEVPLVTSKVAALLRHLKGYKVSCCVGSADAKHLMHWREIKGKAAVGSEYPCGFDTGHQGAAVAPSRPRPGDASVASWPLGSAPADMPGTAGCRTFAEPVCKSSVTMYDCRLGHPRHVHKNLLAHHQLRAPM